MTDMSKFAAVAQNRLHYTTGTATGEYGQIRLPGTGVLTGVDANIPDPIAPTIAQGHAITYPSWSTNSPGSSRQGR